MRKKGRKGKKDKTESDSAGVTVQLRCQDTFLYTYLLPISSPFEKDNVHKHLKDFQCLGIVFLLIQSYLSQY